MILGFPDVPKTPNTNFVSIFCDTKTPKTIKEERPNASRTNTRFGNEALSEINTLELLKKNARRNTTSWKSVNEINMFKETWNGNFVIWSRYLSNPWNGHLVCQSREVKQMKNISFPMRATLTHFIFNYRNWNIALYVHFQLREPSTPQHSESHPCTGPISASLACVPEMVSKCLKAVYSSSIDAG